MFIGIPLKVHLGTLKTPHQDMTLKFVGLESLLEDDIFSAIPTKKGPPLLQATNFASLPSTEASKDRDDENPLATLGDMNIDTLRPPVCQESESKQRDSSSLAIIRDYA